MLGGTRLMPVNKDVSQEFRYLIIRIVCIVKSMLMPIEVEVYLIV